MKILILLVCFSSFAISRLPFSIEKKASNIIPKVSIISKELGVSEDLIISMIWTESHFKKKAVSRVGAKGLMQIMPRTYNYLEKKYKNDYHKFEYLKFITMSLDEDKFRNIFFGILYVKELEKRFNKEKLVIVSYNMGPTWTRRNIKKAGLNNQYLNKVLLKKSLLSRYYYIYKKI